MSLLLGEGLGSQGELSFTLGPATLTALVVAGVLAWLLAWWTGRQAPSGWLRRGELLCWALALGVLVFALAGPVWTEEEGRIEEGRLVVLVDGSASMAVRESGEARAEQVEEILALLGPDVDLYSFDEELRPGAPTSYTGRGSDLGLAISTLADRYLGQELRGVVLISDGIDRGPLSEDLQAARESGGDLDGLLPPLGGPLTVYQVGGEQRIRDSAVEDVLSGGFAFLRTDVSLRAVVRGQPGATLEVSLSREGRVVESKPVLLDAEGRGEVGFTVRPVRVGRFAYEVSIPVEEDDAVPGNNRFSVVAGSLKKRVRVLQVSGSPSYDTSSLRLFLKEDPSVDLVSFFILRTQEDMMSGWSSEELSLIAFPYERLFSEELQTFDLVIFQNFDYRPYFSWGSESLLENIATYVEEGGAFVMTGGDRSFDLGQYAGTPLSRVLPVQLGATGPTSDETPFRPVLTPAGRAHPLTRQGATDAETDAIWQRLPEMDGYNIVAGLAPDSATLLAHPSATVGGAPAPILAVREHGRGRSMALMVDSSWRWSFSEAAEGRGNQAYLRFWKNALRWLMADPEDQRVTVSPSRENVLVGEELRIVVRARDAGYLPLEGERIVGTILSPAGETTPFELDTDASGEAVVLFQGQEQGAHRVEARLSSSSTIRGESVFAVTDRDPELVELEARPQLLRDLAAAAGDASGYRGPGDRSGPLLDADAGRERLDRRVRSLSAVPVVGLLFGLLASAAWWMRRRAGAR